MLSHLPPTSFVPQSLQRLALPELIWSRDQTAAASLLHDFAYCRPFEFDPPSAYLKETKECLTERYGGKGASGNGGGVRCGLMGDMTVKGIGRTDLAGQDAPFWHSYGGSSLREAIREVIWGDIYDAALPFGAVRVEGIIGTGTQVPLHEAEDFGGDTCPRALILRQPFLRPAHYMRSMLFRPMPGFSSKYISDANRTAAAVRQFDLGLRVALQAGATEPMAELLQTAARRYAAQLAVSRAKRLLHGSMTPSNIALDGRLLDFGSSSAVSDHGRISVARTGFPDAWTQHEPIAQALHELCIYLLKYRPGYGIAASDGEQLRDWFQREVERVFRRELLKLSGIPAAALRSLEESEAQRIADCFIAVLEAGNHEPFKLFSPCPGHEPAMPRKMGSYHLGECMKACAEADDPQHAVVLLRPFVADPELRDRLAASYGVLREAAMRLYKDESNLAVFLRFNAFRLNHDLRGLYAPVLNKDIDILLTEQADIADFIENRTREGVMLLRDWDEVGVFEIGNGISVHADPVNGVHARTNAGLPVPLAAVANKLPFSISALEVANG
jgi:hypothetical protein